jgi:surface antigen
MWLLQVSTMPLGAANTTEQLSSANDEQGPRFVEEEGDSDFQAKKKGSALPYILIGLGLVAVGVAVYFLVINKPKYTLNVTLGTGCTGLPAATTKYKKDTAVAYNYSAPAGYVAQVKLDGVAVGASGTVKMDKDHTLTVAADPLYTLTVTLGAGCTGTPAATGTYQSGTVVNYSYSPLTGYAGLQVKLDGVVVPASGTITMDKDKALTITANPLDIRGEWEVSITGFFRKGFGVVFSGEITSGTFKLNQYIDRGKYTVNGENVYFIFNLYPWEYTGKFETNDRMSGTHKYPAMHITGTWVAIRKVATAAMNPSLQTTHSEESILKKY